MNSDGKSNEISDKFNHKYASISCTFEKPTTRTSLEVDLVDDANPDKAHLTNAIHVMKDEERNVLCNTIALRKANSFAATLNQGETCKVVTATEVQPVSI